MNNKRHFPDLMKAFYAMDFSDMYSLLPNLDDLTDNEEYEKETITFNKNGIESKVTVYFNKKGVIYDTISTSVGSFNNKETQLESLQKSLEKALAEEDYIKAHEVNKQIKELQKPK